MAELRPNCAKIAAPVTKTNHNAPPAGPAAPGLSKTSRKNTLQTNAPAQSKTQSRILGQPTRLTHIIGSVGYGCKTDSGQRPPIDVLAHADLPFPQSLPDFQQFFPNDAACAAYLEKARWEEGFACPHCGVVGQPFRFENRPGVLRCRTCRTCRKDTSLTVGTVMQGSHMPLSTWFWAAYLVASQTPGISAVQFQRQLRLTRYETAFGLLHKLRAGMVRPDRDRIGGVPKTHIEVDETWVGGRTRGEGRARVRGHWAY